MPYFHSGDVRLYYEDHGRGYPVVLGHGMSESTELWSGQVQPLAERCRLILWDNRGHGRSDTPADAAADGTAPADALSDQAARARYLERMQRLPVDGYVWAWRSLRRRPSHTERLGEIAVPTLCIAGERHEFLPAVRLLAARIPRAELVVI